MTVKIDLAPLIKYFSDKDRNITARLKSLAGEQNAEKGEINKKASEKSKQKVTKIAQALIQIADELDETDPDLAREADALLKELVAGCGTGGMSSMFMMEPSMMAEPQSMPGPSGTAEPMMAEPSQMAGASYLAEDDLDLEEDLEGDLEDKKEEGPKEDFDEVSLDEFLDRIKGLTFRLTDRDRKSRWEEASHLAEKSMKHFNRGRELMEKAHGKLDEGGDRIRFKTDYSWK